MLSSSRLGQTIKGECSLLRVQAKKIIQQSTPKIIIYTSPWGSSFMCLQAGVAHPLANVVYVIVVIHNIVYVIVAIHTSV